MWLSWTDHLSRTIASRHLTYVAVLALGFAVGVLAHTWWVSDDEDVDDLNVMDEDADPATSGECKMILGVRMDLKMDKGKMAAQCGHATLAVYKAAVKQRPDYVLAWQRRGQTKIAIKIPDEARMDQLLADAKKTGIPAEVIQDAYVQAPIAQMDQLTRTFKLL
ncbi:unnamed protein product [Malassezia sympodialis ATCC 42132]|uniref:uncharacterized protein n=1 Tax=Malassezia sympodialis (strain ATCC 42132) TaxID=1230383 RepID=UPI0002C255DC|nr:uncharacterized protein MSY001_0818 [Malassezia sympodialis ATCC 42132]CCU98112.1 unnamed protein product [Malassezia sympodialis ATCC 42132]|eukprot:XP_018739434.1 uncharacterized protein MSY001_0818 [Malassezia sympodialis ATCC 42132]